MRKAALFGIGLLLAVGSASAEQLVFHCTSNFVAGRVWKYTFDVDTSTSEGVIEGVTYAGTPYAGRIETVFTPARMIINTTESPVSRGWVDRVTLDFEFGGAQGVCAMVRPGQEKKQF